MPLLAALLLSAAASTGGADASALCDGIDSDIEPEMRIREADLDRSSAAEAARWLGERIARGELDGEFEFGVFNRLNVILGHALRQQALAARNASAIGSREAAAATETFCRWLARDGFRHD
jgi:hypothetical protein